MSDDDLPTTNCANFFTVSHPESMDVDNISIISIENELYRDGIKEIHWPESAPHKAETRILSIVCESPKFTWCFHESTDNGFKLGLVWM